MSVEPSRAATPNPGDDESFSQADGDTPADPTKSPKARTKSGSGKPMFQYGDWFDKYPHGVSETEWETSHLPHRKEAQKGTEAVMSQQSDLQSVEEFFASLSPPSKVDSEAAATGQRGRKVAKKRGKSIADNASTTPSSATGAGGSGKGPQRHVQSQSQAQVSVGGQKQVQPTQQAHRHSASSLSGIAPETIVNTSDIDIPMSEYTSAQKPQPLQSQSGNAFDIQPPSSRLSSNLFLDPLIQGLGQSPQQARGSYAFSIDSPTTMSNPGSTVAQNQLQPGNANNPQMNFNFNYTSALPHLDRQMVFGAYAGIDPSNSNNSSALNNPNNLDFWNNPWDTIDTEGFSGFNDPYGFNNTGAGDLSVPVNNAGNAQGGMAGNGMLNSSAWFMPFNIDPPDYGMDEITFGGVDAMDMSGDTGDANAGGGRTHSGSGGGSFSAPNNPPT